MSDLDYAMARHYRSREGRFLTPAPGHVGGNIGDPQSWIAYAYSRNDPINFVDPSGLRYALRFDPSEIFSGGDADISDAELEYFGNRDGYRLLGDYWEFGARGWITYGGQRIGEYSHYSLDGLLPGTVVTVGGGDNGGGGDSGGGGGGVPTVTVTLGPTRPSPRQCRENVFGDAYGPAGGLVPLFSLMSLRDDFSETFGLWVESVGSKLVAARAIETSGARLIQHGQVLESQAYRLATNRGTRVAAGRLMGQSAEMIAAGATIRTAVGVGLKALGTVAGGATIGFTAVDVAARQVCGN